MKKLFITLAIVLTASIVGNATENSATIEPVFTDEYGNEYDESEIVTKPDQNPEFPGGLQGLMHFLGSNLRYPAVAAKEKIEGRVLLKFVVNTMGEVENISVERSVSPELDAEAIRVVSLLPKFNPGKLNGEPVNVWFALPITFKLP